MKKITPAQCRAARGFVDISQKDFAKKCEMALRTIREFENGNRTPIRANMDKMIRALEELGVLFTETGGVEPATKKEEVGGDG